MLFMHVVSKSILSGELSGHGVINAASPSGLLVDFLGPSS